MRRYLRTFGITSAVVLGGVAALNWSVDPLQLYRAAKYPPLLVEQERYRLPGLARHTNAQVIIEGTSVSAGQKAEEAARVFGGPALNLAMQGPSAREQSLLLRLALAHPSTRDVIWDIHFEYLRGKPEWVSDYDGAFPIHLYDNNPWNDIAPYLLSADTCKNSFRIFTRNYSQRSPESFRWVVPGATFGRAAIEKAMERRRNNAGVFRALLPQFTPEQLHANFEANVASVVRAHPNVRFHLFLPPFSAAYFDFLREIAPELIPVFLQFRQDVFAQCQSLPNAVLHDPQSDIMLIEDLDRYLDPIHFNDATQSLLLEGIHDGRWKASAERLEAFRVWLNERTPK